MIKILVWVFIIIFIIIPLLSIGTSIVFGAVKMLLSYYKDGVSIVSFNIFLADYLNHKERYKLRPNYVFYSISYDTKMIITIRFRLKDYLKYRRFFKLIKSEECRDIDKYYLSHLNESKYDNM